jgi:hypothetical protein
VSAYALDDRAIEVRCPAEERIFPLTSVSRSTLGFTQPPVQWVVPRSRMSRSYTSSPPSASMVCSATDLAFNVMLEESTAIALKIQTLIVIFSPPLLKRWDTLPL